MTFVPDVQNFVVELLSGIFLECLPKDGVVQLKSNEAPLNVSQVCQHWRNVALSTRPLWAGLRVLCADDKIALDSSLPALRVFLERSGSAPFCVEFEVPRNIAGPSHVQNSSPPQSICWKTLLILIDELLERPQRIKSIALSLSGSLASSATTYVLERFHNLEHLSLRYYGGILGVVQVQLSNAFWTTASRLSSLDIICTVNLLFDISGIQTLQRLRYLTLNIVNEELHHYLLNACPALESFRLDPTYRIARVDGARKPLPAIQALTSLRNLELVCDDDISSILSLLSKIRCPQLRRLEVIKCNDTTMFQHLVTFITTSQPPLEELCWTKCGSRDYSSISSTLSSLPDLRMLRIRLSPSTSRALVLPNTHGLTNGGKGICPLLEEITLEIDEMAFEDSITIWSVVEDMVRSRWISPSRSRKGRAKLTATESSSESIVCSYKRLRRVNFPDIKEHYWKRHQLYKCLKDCQKQGLVIGLDKETG